MKIILNQDTPIEISQVSLTWKDGSFQSPPQWTFPDFKVWLKEEKVFLPIAQDETGLYTDSDWVLVSQFAEELEENENCFSFLSMKTKDILNEWAVCCPSLKNYQTPFGYIMKLSSDSSRDYDGVAELLQAFKKKWNKLSLNQLSEFKDLGRNALDLTFLHQNWDLANLCWEKGLRFSDDPLIRGDILATFVSQKRTSFLGFKCDISQEKWVEIWRDRFEELGMWEKIAQYSTQHKYKLLTERGFLTSDAPIFQENALAFYLETLCRSTKKEMPLDDLKEEQRWIKSLRSTIGWEDLRVFNLFNMDKFILLTETVEDISPKIERFKALVDQQTLSKTLPSASSFLKAPRL